MQSVFTNILKSYYDSKINEQAKFDGEKKVDYEVEYSDDSVYDLDDPYMDTYNIKYSHKALLKKCVKGTYTINEDGSIDVNGDVKLIRQSLKKIPFNFRKVSGDFECSGNQLTTLEGCPEYVGGTFSCSFNNLTSLKGCPKFIGNNFYCWNNQLTTLEGAPISVGGDFNCSNNNLSSLEGCPKNIGEGFDCSFNQLITLKGCPKNVGGVFNCSRNKLKTLKFAPKLRWDLIMCFDNVAPENELLKTINITKLMIW